LVVKLTSGIGFIVIEKIIGIPVHSFNVDDTVIIPVILAPVLLAGAFQLDILPLPLAAKPIAVLEFVHEKVAPVGELVKLLMLIGTPGQTAILFICVTIGAGYTVIVKLMGVPGHPLSDGVTIIVPVIFAPVLFAGAFQLGIFPVPLVAKPIAALEFVHEKAAPVGILAKLPMLIGKPGQTAMSFFCVIDVFGYIITVKIIGVPGHPLEDGVTVIVPVIFDPVLFVGAFQLGIFPLPLVAKPIAILEFVHKNVAPDGVLAKLPMLIGEPGQTAILVTCITVGAG